MLKLRDAVRGEGCDASVTVTTNENVPVFFGEPLIVPVVDESERPCGSVPELILQLYGVTPPVAWIVAEYARLKRAAGRLVVVIASGSVATGVTVFEAPDSGPDPMAFVAWTVKA